MRLNHFQIEERELRDQESRRARNTVYPRAVSMPFDSTRKLAPKPMATARELSNAIPADAIEVACDGCVGTGFDPGGLDPFGELCPECRGAKKQQLVYPSGAVRIAEVA